MASRFAANQESQKFTLMNCPKKFSNTFSTIPKRRLPHLPNRPLAFNRQINRLNKLLSSEKKKNKWHWNRHGEQRKKLPRHKTRQSSGKIRRQPGGMSWAWVASTGWKLKRPRRSFS